MKKYLYDIAALACAAFALAGCIQNEEWTSGTLIRFGAATQAENLTRTEYGAIVDGSPRKQMVNWCANDTLRIVCAQASTAEAGTSTSADYKTSAGVRYNSSAESRATLTLAGNNDKGLRWGSTTEAHTFYAVYPSPAAKSGVALTTDGGLTGRIPAVQEVDDINNASPYTAIPDMKNQYMVAKRTVEAGKQKIGNDEVLLNFTPITTAIQFGIKNKMDSDLAIQSIEISSASKNLSGTFTTSLSNLNEDGGKPYPTVTAGGDASKAAAVSFGDTGLTLAVDDSLTFTIFLLPESDLNDLTFKIYKVGGGTIKTALKYDESTWIPFGRCQKHFINGLFVNEGAIWTLCFNPEVFPWDHKAENKDLVDPSASGAPKLIFWSAGEEKDIYLNEPDNYQFSLETGVPSTQSFTNPESGREKTFDIRSTKNTTISQDWKIKSVGGVNVSGTSFTTADGDLKVEKDSDGNLKVTDLRQKVSNGDHKHWNDNSTGNVWYSEDRSGTYTASNPMDLSKYDFKTDAARSNMRTANCYIIRHAGTYKIPLVYGNAIDYVKNTSTGENTDAYNPSGVTSGTYVLKPFVNNKGGIISPFIENNRKDGGTSFSNDKRFVASSASVIWQDNPDVNITASVTPHSAGSFKCTASNCGYIKFSVDTATIAQCNALIAVRDASSNILWSWHIWITNDPKLSNDPISVNDGTRNHNFMTMPCIGWIEPQMYEGKEDVTIVLEQEESGETLTVTVKQLLYDTFSSNGTYYQWGRKDPMLAALITGKYQAVDGPATTLAQGILNPGTFYKINGTGDWCSESKFNLWSGKYTGTEENSYSDNMIKTVYDPSPVGYKVPSPKAYSSIGTTFSLVGAGYDDRKDGIKHSGSSPYYWTSVSNSTVSSGRSFKSAAATNNKSEGFSIRPVTE